MKKSDLKSGMIVKLRNNIKYIVIENVLCRNNGFIHLSSFKEDLTIQSQEASKDWDIVEIYYCISMNPLRSFIEDKDLKLIWKREEKETIDWLKIPFGTPVRVYDYINKCYIEGKFLGYRNNNEFPFLVFIDTDRDIEWSICELLK